MHPKAFVYQIGKPADLPATPDWNVLSAVFCEEYEVNLRFCPGTDGQYQTAIREYQKSVRLLVESALKRLTPFIDKTIIETVRRLLQEPIPTDIPVAEPGSKDDEVLFTLRNCGNTFAKLVRAWEETARKAAFPDAPSSEPGEITQEHGDGERDRDLQGITKGKPYRILHEFSKPHRPLNHEDTEIPDVDEANTDSQFNLGDVDVPHEDGLALEQPQPTANAGKRKAPESADPMLAAKKKRFSASPTPDRDSTPSTILTYPTSEPRSRTQSQEPEGPTI
ncbi:hypothetical protein C8J56DRAFT_971755 [Mycena floridula]|nr:hypothetical protein C8J56DRAFT_971755 [Mycena floridula]